MVVIDRGPSYFLSSLYVGSPYFMGRMGLFSRDRLRLSHHVILLTCFLTPLKINGIDSWRRTRTEGCWRDYSLLSKHIRFEKIQKGSLKKKAIMVLPGSVLRFVFEVYRESLDVRYTHPTVCRERTFFHSWTEVPVSQCNVNL